MTPGTDTDPTKSGDTVRRRLTRCSFCGRLNRETGMQVEGPNEVYICRHCVGVAQDIFAREWDAAQRGSQPPPSL